MRSFTVERQLPPSLTTWVWPLGPKWWRDQLLNIVLIPPHVLCWGTRTTRMHTHSRTYARTHTPLKKRAYSSKVEFFFLLKWYIIHLKLHSYKKRRGNKDALIFCSTCYMNELQASPTEQGKPTDEVTPMLVSYRSVTVFSGGQCTCFGGTHSTQLT